MNLPLEIKRSGGTRVTRGSGGGKGAKAPSAPGGGAPAAAGAEAARRELDAIRVLRQATSVLEQELAAGIAAARRIEERFLDVQQLRQRGPEEVTQRFRADVHEVVDIVFDVITLAVDKAQSFTEGRFSVSGRPVAAPRTAQAPAAPRKLVQTLSPPQPLQPGQTAELVIAVENEGSQPTRPVTFTCSDLVNGAGGSIPGSNVRCAPSELVLAPRATERVAVQIHVPPGTAPGSYCGMFQASHLPAVRAVLVVEVRGAA